MIEQLESDFNNLKKIFDFYQKQYDLFTPTDIKILIFQYICNYYITEYLSCDARLIVNANYKNLIVVIEDNIDFTTMTGLDIWKLYVICIENNNLVEYCYRKNFLDYRNGGPYKLWDTIKIKF